VVFGTENIAGFAFAALVISKIKVVSSAVFNGKNAETSVIGQHIAVFAD